jgi:hypothetical protein
MGQQRSGKSFVLNAPLTTFSDMVYGAIHLMPSERNRKQYTTLSG